MDWSQAANTKSEGTIGPHQPEGATKESYKQGSIVINSQLQKSSKIDLTMN